MPIVSVKNISLKFKMEQNRANSLKEFCVRWLKRDLKSEDFWALTDVSFDVEKCDVIGIIGHNGAGKSTLLKGISGIIKPTKGTIEAHGNIVPMLELGSGFDMELSGRENIYLNGAILGYSEEFLNEKYDEIVEVSELKDFIDGPIKNYSSGMKARLGFAIATAVEPEVLILDEVLSVGDAKFRRKSEAKVTSMFDKGVTVLFVSHSTEQVRRLCDKAIILEKGKIIAQGEVNEICDLYDDIVNKK